MSLSTTELGVFDNLAYRGFSIEKMHDMGNYGWNGYIYCDMTTCSIRGDVEIQRNYDNTEQPWMYDLQEGEGMRKPVEYPDAAPSLSIALKEKERSKGKPSSGSDEEGNALNVYFCNVIFDVYATFAGKANTSNASQCVGECLCQIEYLEKVEK